MAMAIEEFVHEEEEVDDHHPMKYLPIHHVYSSSAPCINPSGSSSVMSKKVKAHKLEIEQEAEAGQKEVISGGKALLVYKRRRKREESEETSSIGADSPAKKRKRLNYELIALGDSGEIRGSRLRGCAVANRNDFREIRQRGVNGSSGRGKMKRWVELDFEGADPNAFVGMACKVFWPLDDAWYRGSVNGYDSETKKHYIKYDDGEAEDVMLMNEKIKFHVSCEEMQRLNLKYGVLNMENKGLNYNEMLALAASFDDCQDLEPGDLVWAKITGFSMWPAVIVGETVAAIKRLKPPEGEQSVPVQFFGTHDFSRIKLKQTIPFLNGLLSSLHLKCKSKDFCRSLDEAKLYLSRQKLPRSMLQLQKGISADSCKGASGADEERTNFSEDVTEDEMLQEAVECLQTYPLEIGNLRITSLGKIVCDSNYFHDKQYIWPEGYTAFRSFISLKDPSLKTTYKLEVLRNPKSKNRPLFRVTSGDGEQYGGSDPTACWKEIYDRIRNKQCNGFHADAEGCDFPKSGSDMFGFSDPKVSQLIQDLRRSKLCLKNFKSCWDLPMGYRAVRVDWKDLDRCSVCHMDEEYEDNLFLQCDKCRMMVHARCYGELEPLDGVLWLCNLCRPGAPITPPPCCLCPVIGGAIKPTTDGRWAHLACAMWIPETCLADVKRMEPIDGLSRINKDRWKLLCSICGVSYGACIQCSNSTCRVAYHPLCARAAGLCVELEDEDRIHLMSLDEDDDQCIRLLSFCKKHRQPCKERPPADENLALPDECGSSYIPASNPSGCARSEPYNFFGRRGQKEPQVLAAASLKRLFVENKPHLVSGYRQNGMGCGSCCDFLKTAALSQKLRNQHQTFEIVSSMAEKYKNMKTTFRKRLAFGKSKIHGFGVFAKVPHKAGDMVIEYTGELVRPSIADIREHCIYNSLVGAGTYMFRIDDERVIDATRAGSIAHLINHSCEPNCYSRVITVNGDEHIIIFAKRDLNQWEELTYDYRFFSRDEQLACYCGFPRCRGVVNDIDAEEQVTKVLAPRSDLIHWSGE